MGSAEAPGRFNALAWGANNMLAGGLDTGAVTLWSAAAEQQVQLVCTEQRHSAAVRALEFNSFQPNQLVTGAAAAELLVWDVSKQRGRGKERLLTLCDGHFARWLVLLYGVYLVRCALWSIGCV